MNATSPIHPILLVEDDAQLRAALAETLRLAGHPVIECADGTAALAALADANVAAVVTDYQMRPMDGLALLQEIRARHPHLPVLVITAHGSIERAVRCMLEGASDFLVKPFPAQALLERLRRLLPNPGPAGNVVAADPLTLQLLDLAQRVAATEATVLLAGESGTGKEVVARYIHQSSPRAGAPFVAINCAAIPENMLEALLFGHEKGAFTGATETRPGKFEQAQGGTLLLDEITEMDLSLQAKLLRVLQEREVERIGARTPIPLDVRVLATTNRDLRRQVAEGRFREDLYYRLSVFPLGIPPLRQRPRDIVPLARHFLAEAAGSQRPVPILADEAAELLTTHDWPGNVRELQNLMQRALILCSGHEIRARDLRFEFRLEPVATSVAAAEAATPAATVPAAPLPAPAARPADSPLHDNLQTVEGRLILEAIQRAGSRQRAAQILGISPRTLRYKIARLRDAGIPIPRRGEDVGNVSALGVLG